MTLDKFGLDHYLKKTKQPKPSGPIARIITENKTGWEMIAGSERLEGIVPITFRRSHKANQLPKVGDFVLFEKLNGEAKGKIIVVLPRFSSLSRQKQHEQQTLATNIDTVVIVLGLDQDYNAHQLDRYLAMAKTGKAEAVVAVNKLDKQTSANNWTNLIHKAHPKLEIFVTSAKTKIGLGKLEKKLISGQTVVFVGNSGAGKSSLINALMEHQTQSTSSVRKDGKGRHTTTRREMFLLPTGAIVIDTPGIRTVELDTQTSSIFTDLDELAKQCKFRNCDHVKSSGCAIQAALKSGKISEQQVRQFTRLHSYDNSEEKIHLTQLRKAKHKQITKSLKKFYKKK